MPRPDRDGDPRSCKSHGTDIVDFNEACHPIPRLLRLRAGLLLPADAGRKPAAGPDRGRRAPGHRARPLIRSLADADPAFGVAATGQTIDAVRDAVRNGTLRYMAVMATAGSAQ